jgi:hypothetical protein
MKDELTKRVDALYHRGLSWPLAASLREREDLELLALLAHLEQMSDDDLWALYDLSRLLGER